MRSAQNSIGVRHAASRAACSTLAIDRRFMVSIIEKAGASGIMAGTWTSGCERPGSRRTDAEAAASALPWADRFAAGAGVRPRSRRTDPEAATKGLALAERFVLEAGLRIFLLDLRAIVFPLLGFVPLPIPEA